MKKSNGIFEWSVVATASTPDDKSADSDHTFGANLTADQDFGAIKSADQDFGAIKSAEEDFGATKSVDQDFGAIKSADQEFGTIKSTDEDFGAMKSAENDFGAKSTSHMEQEFGAKGPSKPVDLLHYSMAPSSRQIWQHPIDENLNTSQFLKDEKTNPILILAKTSRYACLFI